MSSKKEEKRNGITKENYARLSEWEQGYISYMQGAWNKNVDNENPYDISTPKYEQFNAGSIQAMLNVQDSEE